MYTTAQKEGLYKKAPSAAFSRPWQATSAPPQNQHALLQLQRTIGNQAVQRMLKPKEGDPESKIPSQHTTPFFSSVHPSLLQRKCACGGETGSSGECEECRRKRLQREAGGAGHGSENNSIAPPIVHEVLRSSGQPLDAETRAFMEPRFGQDFSQVRVYTDSRAAESAKAVNASAYAVGSNVVFGSGQYAPGNAGGLKLLAHELAHVGQQRGMSQGVTPPGQIELGAPGDAFEIDAEAQAEKVLNGRRVEGQAQSTAMLLSGAWENCGKPSDCPKREPGEEKAGAKPNFSVGGLDAPESGEIISGFAIGSSDVSALQRDPTWLAFEANIASGSDRWEILGFSDCGGAADLNQNLRQGRATTVLASLAPGAKAKIDRAVGAPLSDCVASNDSSSNRTFNRAVVFRRTAQTINFPDEKVEGKKLPPGQKTDRVNCTSGNEKEIDGAVPIARAMVSHAIQVLQRHPDPAITALLDKYFKDHGAATYLHAIEGYQTLLGGISGSFTIECEQPGSFMYDYFCPSGVLAYNRSHAPWSSVHLCGLAFGRSPTDLAETIAHESSHKFNTTDDKAYCWGGCPAGLDAGSAMDNADSFSKFAWDAYLNLP